MEKVPGRCFYWKGEYLAHWNDRITHDTQLNVFEHFSPKIPEKYRESNMVFLGNIHPDLQDDVLKQMGDQPTLVALDTMNLWIQTTRAQLIRVLKNIDLLFVNDSEAIMLSGKHDLVEAARTICTMGPSTVCVKRGENGAILIDDSHIFTAPAYPLCKVVDPTGAGDTFAGGFLGYLAKTGDLSFENMRRAVIYGSVMGSFTVESFSVDRCAAITDQDIEDRYHAFVDLTHFHR
jgi:sugar/nucleoside kinase (ribokinase family)